LIFVPLARLKNLA